MKKAAEISYIQYCDGVYYIKYESGYGRKYGRDKLPKTARAWLDTHKEEAEQLASVIEYSDKLDDNMKFYDEVLRAGRSGERLTPAVMDRIRKCGKETVVYLANRLGYSILGGYTKREALRYLANLNNDEAA